MISPARFSYIMNAQELGRSTLAETIVSFRHVSMQFPGVLANDDVSLDIRKGEVFALVGENGAG